MDCSGLASRHHQGIQIDGGISDVTLNHNAIVNPHGLA
jgi:hypothetical protein